VDACGREIGGGGKFVDFETLWNTVWAESRNDAAMLPTEVVVEAGELVGGCVVLAIVLIVEGIGDVKADVPLFNYS